MRAGLCKAFDWEHLLTNTAIWLIAILWLASGLIGCQQQMAEQPYYRPLEASQLFADGRSARPIQAGTVPQGPPEVGQLLFTGRISKRVDRQALPQDAQSSLSNSQSLGGKSLEDYSTQFPFPITLQELVRGQERFTIFCAVCHGPTGNGDGIVVQRGYTRPPSYITDDSRGLAHRGIRMPLRDVPAGYLFEVVSKGYGAMADYSAQVPVHDRWDIVAYIRTLQFSQQTPRDKLPPDQQDAARAALEATP
jgi:mono/diheme cytochrome c family protein